MSVVATPNTDFFDMSRCTDLGGFGFGYMVVWIGCGIVGICLFCKRGMTSMRYFNFFH